MHVIKFFSFVSFVAITCSAAPIIQSLKDPSLTDIRGDGELAGGVSNRYSQVFTYREKSDELEARSQPPQGMQHKNEHAVKPTLDFHPVPENSLHKTGNNVYTGAEVNKAAANMIKMIQQAPEWNRKKGQSTYPKTSTGFRPNEADNPAPPDPHSVSYHHPIHKNGQDKSKPDRDRIVGYRSTSSSALHVGVSYHDDTKPIPPSPPGSKQSTNHPFSMAKVRGPDGEKIKTKGPSGKKIDKYFRNKEAARGKANSAPKPNNQNGPKKAKIPKVGK